MDWDDIIVKTTPEDLGMTQEEFDDMKRKEAAEEREEAGIIRVMLDKEDHDRSEVIAHTRNKGRGQYQNHLKGAIGEVAVEKYLNSVFKDPHCYVDEGDIPDDGWDLCWKDRLIDVKTKSKIQQDCLEVTRKAYKRGGCDFYMFVSRGWDFADIMGWISRKDYKENCCRPFPDTYQLFACDLNPMPIFISEEFNDEYTPRKRRKRLGRLGGKSIVWEYA